MFWLGTAANMLCTVPGLLSMAMGDMTGGFGSEDVYGNVQSCCL